MDEKVAVWGLSRGGMPVHKLATLVGHTHWVSSCVWSPDGSTIASACDEAGRPRAPARAPTVPTPESVSVSEADADAQANPVQAPEPQPPEPDAATSKRTSLITFADPRAQAFQVDGTKIPEGEVHTLALRLLRG